MSRRCKWTSMQPLFISLDYLGVSVLPLSTTLLFWFWNCSYSVVFVVFGFGIVPTLWYLLFLVLELFLQCGICCFWFWNCSYSVVFVVFGFGIVPTV